MQTRQLGNSDLHITPVGFGAWAIGGGGWQYTWGPQDDQQSIAAIHAALDAGVNWIDTAAVYGLGHSEEVVGRALKSTPHKPYVFTKCEMVWDEYGNISESLKAASIRREVENSLRRLDIDVIDLYQIHWPDPDEDIEEGWEAVNQLKAEGKIRWAGVSNFDVEQLQRAGKIAPVTSLQPPYSLIKREVERDILPYCLQNNIGVIVYSPMQAGLLTGAMTHERVASFDEGDWRRTDEEFEEPRLSCNLRWAGKLAEIGARHGVAAGVVAIAWTLNNPAVTGAIVGSRSAQQAAEIFPAALDFRLSADEAAEIENFVTTVASHG